MPRGPVRSVGSAGPGHPSGRAGGGQSCTVLMHRCEGGGIIPGRWNIAEMWSHLALSEMARKLAAVQVRTVICSSELSVDLSFIRLKNGTTLPVRQYKIRGKWVGDRSNTTMYNYFGAIAVCGVRCRTSSTWYTKLTSTIGGYIVIRYTYVYI